jgi:hypothetical protein
MLLWRRGMRRGTGGSNEAPQHVREGSKWESRGGLERNNKGGGKHLVLLGIVQGVRTAKDIVQGMNTAKAG